MTELKQTDLYLPVKVEDYTPSPFEKVVFVFGMGNEKGVKYAHDVSKSDISVLCPSTGYFFTPEQLFMKSKQWFR